MIGLRFHLNGTTNARLVRKISSYALSHGVDELEPNAIIANTFPARLFECLKTLKLGSCTITSFPDSPFGHFVLLTTLQLYKVWFLHNYDDKNNGLFSSFPNLENLSLIKCLVVSDCKMSFNISHPQLVHLMISCPKFRVLWLVVSAPSLKILNLNGTHPLIFIMNKRQTLEKVNINLFPPPVSREIKNLKQTYISYLNRMAKGLCYSKSLRVSLAFSKGKFLLYRQNSDHDAEMKFEELKETEEDWLSFALPMDGSASVHGSASGICRWQRPENMAANGGDRFDFDWNLKSDVNITIECDSQAAVSCVNGAGDVGNLMIRECILDIKEILLSCKPRLSVKVTSRGSNAAADFLTNQGVQSGLVQEAWV
ncbi:hypothetical protein EZV62_020885 [Acer yangbiense]|uniref:Uncharacterized protein n=1 Tax=Acer yangbiense TaxID=1000413 RepID=A0A5C7HFL6_9ROSI|nr:hypothetical protein EZV62_020885 [Acer yangbiense]